LTFYLEGISLVNHYLDSTLVLLSISLGPPVIQVSISVVLAASIIESMSHLVTNDSSDSTIVDSVISLRIEERRL
jgi:hypothetical protein